MKTKAPIILFQLLFANTLVFAHGDIKFHLQLSLEMADAKGVVALVEDKADFEYGDGRVSKTTIELKTALESFFKENPPQSFQFTNHGYFKDQKRHMEGIYITKSGKKFQLYFEAV